MSPTEEHNACIGRAFNRRKHAQRELDELETQAIKLGIGMADLGQKLMKLPPGRVSQDVADNLQFGDISCPYPPIETVIGLFNRIDALREEIEELNAILA